MAKSVNRRQFLLGKAAAETHIVSCVAYVQPEMAEAISQAITRTGLAEVPRSDGLGKLVVLIEAPTSAAILDVMDAVRALDGVLALHIAYQHSELATDLQEPHE
ncbi:MAG TPA: chaperone NapD [Usitatibacter sp.]|nr:chaperone NapD [Usitatibacter sp.]